MSTEAAISSNPISSTQARVAAYDWARTFAIMSVVCCHAFELPAHVYGLPGVSLGFSTWIYAIGLALGRIGVPFFLMLTGALVLTKRFETMDDVWRFYRRSLIPLLITYEIWVVIYTLFNWGAGFAEPHLVPFLKDVLLLHDGPVVSAWYMPMILGLYLAAPLVAIVLQRVPQRLFLLIGACVGLDELLIPAAKRIMWMLGMNTDWMFYVDTRYFGGLFGLYMVCGYFLCARNLLRNVSKVVLVACAAIGFAGAVGFTLFYTRYNQDNMLFYDEPFLALCTVALFELIRRSSRFSTASDIIMQVSKLSFAVYLIHIIPVMLLSRPGCPILALPFPIAALLIFVFSLVIALAVAGLASRCTKLSRILFDMK